MTVMIKYKTEQNTLASVNHVDDIPENASFIWYDFDDPTESESHMLLTDFNFNKLEIDDTVNGTPRAKFKAYDTYQYMVFHDLNQPNYSIKALNIFIHDNTLITYHHHEFDIEQQIEYIIQKYNDLKVIDIVLFLLDQLVDQYFDKVHEVEDRVFEFEDHHIEDSANPSFMDKVYRLRSKIIKLQRLIYPMHELVDDLKESPKLLVDDKNHLYIQHIEDHLIKQIHILKQSQEMTNEIRDNNLSYTSFKMNRVMQVLTLVSVIFLPLTLISGIYGMNFENMPELKWHYGYFIVLAVMLLISISCIVYFKKKKWF
ncbi:MULTISPECIES: magnesium/cobalt transporter CorA [Staphylococcus]|uniref:Magnesium transport protein CorA n=1 Tax=Staphylococcus hsinchuensis TaxID=3051183 RepID=A0ABZ3EE78_9STAP|nr:magnesium/cobalt transporter CorA [Staphylococcus sp. Marseille-Q5304]